MEPFLGSVMPPACIGPPSSREVNAHSESSAVRQEFGHEAKKCEAFFPGSVEPQLFDPGIEPLDPA